MDFIPKVKAPINKATKESEPNFVYSDEELEADVHGQGETGDVNVTGGMDDESDLIDEEDILPPRPKIKQEDIFVDDNLAVMPDELIKKPKKINKNGKERKPMSEEHKLKLKASREKAMLVKKQRAKERAALKEQDLEEKKLLKMKKQKDKKKQLDQLKKEVYEDSITPAPAASSAPAPAPAPAPAAAPAPAQAPMAPVVREIIKDPSFTIADIERAQLNAIMAHEKLRLQRKEEKKKKQSEEQEYARLKDKLLKAQNPRNNFSASRGFF